MLVGLGYLDVLRSQSLSTRLECSRSSVWEQTFGQPSHSTAYLPSQTFAKREPEKEVDHGMISRQLDKINYHITLHDKVDFRVYLLISVNFTIAFIQNDATTYST
jgi:hypothetical protein